MVAGEANNSAAGRHGLFGDIGGCLPVPNVQSLAASCVDASDIPERYFMPELSAELVIDGSGGHDDRNLPVIDLSRLLHPNHAGDELDKLGSACREWGFFQLVGHGVPEEMMERMKSAVHEFFQLPPETKKLYAQKPGSAEGYGQSSIFSDEQKLQWNDMVFLSTHPASSRNPSLWPAQPPSFSDSLKEYSEELRRVGRSLVGCIAEQLELAVPERLTEMFEEGRQSVRINYYPPCPLASKVMGLSKHSDSSALTLLLQVNQVQGLQVKKDGLWFPVKPLAGAIIVNVGDVLEMVSNGRYRSVEHRAVVSEEKERMSVVMFLSPRLDATIGPLPELARRDGGDLYKTIGALEFLKIAFSNKVEKKDLIEEMKLKL